MRQSSILIKQKKSKDNIIKFKHIVWSVKLFVDIKFYYLLLILIICFHNIVARFLTQ